MDTFRRSIRANVIYWRTSLHATQPVTSVADHVWQNVVRAILYGCEERSAWVDAAQFAIGLFDLMQHRGAWHEWGAVLQRVADALQEEPALKSRVLGQLGQCLILDDKYEAAAQTLEQAEQLGLAVGDTELIVRSRVSLSESYRYLLRYEDAERLGRQALSDLPRLPDTPERVLIEVAALSTLGVVLSRVGRPLEGEALLQTALTRLDPATQPIEVSRLCNHIASALSNARRLEEAIEYLDRALEHLSPLPNVAYDRAMIALTKGAMYFGLGRLPDAEATFRAINADELRRLGYWVYAAYTANNLGNVYQQLGRLPEAEAKLSEALALMRDLEDDVELANVLVTLGEVVEAQGRRVEAEPMWREAAELAEKYPTDTRARRYATKSRKYLAG
jgi:tetratricopeptide (TPR) repeat protein